MVASNDHTHQNLREAVEYCDMVEDGNIACHDFRQKLYYMEKSLHLKKVIRRIKTSLPVSTGCETTFDLLRTVNDGGALKITPDNFRSLIEEGPLVVLKSQNNCGTCLYLLNLWDSITDGFDPPLRFGVLHCFQGQCSSGEDELYKQLLDAF